MKMCSQKWQKNNAFVRIFANFLFFFIISVNQIAAQQKQQQPSGNPGTNQQLTQLLYSSFSNFTALFDPAVTDELKFCIEDVDAEWNAAFNFTGNTDFLTACISQTKGDVLKRLCTAAEVKFFSQLLTQGGGRGNLKPNKNCNLSSWAPGCEPGWACSVGDNLVRLKDAKEMPPRILDCQPCCEGFFCPRGLTCMIPCPLGAYCPLSDLNDDSGACDPYHYQPPPGQANHSCGGADVWADVLSTTELFCSAGFYCPTTALKIPCNKGHYCRTGSTSQTSCYKLAICESQTDNQNITAYGIMFFGGITLILTIIYNCSGQVLSSRERKHAKSRERAAKSARENVQAREKWKSAKEIARKHATGLQSQLSRTFSRKKYVSQQDPQKAPSHARSRSEAALPPLPLGMSHAKAKKQTNLTKMVQELEENPDSHDGFNIEIGDKNMKKPKVEKLQTKSQIFKYAYGQIEKEKAMQEQNKNLTFSGVISMASDIEIRTRPPIEVCFKDLTLTLKGKNKHLLRCVSGKLSPGRVSAVMGPSGAGKTTFLSALTGKAAGCTMTGVILINGKPEPMQSYKKIIGFVPQDDIVHGNLTVEENLWFSARCRLAADLPKPEKVLVVERVIESLGLQPVRDSLVGTVEKRGISGGQRKRVNVGLEMVMEPSLLILDEPTSGLDSSSSQLLLRATRREALEGVNVCMVVHQPSYTLFRMFDDLILLAKGGLTVYHGPVKTVEEYFAGIGITVPDRVNPPDHFIDILEGIYKLPSTGLSYKDLPLRWMLHNGYPIPPDMLDSSGSRASSVGENSADGASPATVTSDQSVDLWADVKSNVEQKKDRMRFNFLAWTDLSNRKTPGVLLQYKYFLGRVGKQRLREARIQAVDFLILLLAGLCLGTVAEVSDETFGFMGYLYTVIAVPLLTKIAALRSFSLDKLHYWRESASGMSGLAYFMAKDTIDHINTIIKPAVYLSMFYFFNNPRSSILDNYLVLLCVVYCVTGIAYALAIYFEPGQAQLWSVLLPVVLTLVASKDSSSFTGKLGDYIYSKWALEAFIIANAKRYSGVWLITRCGLLRKKGYALDHWYPCLLKLILLGAISRCIAFFLLITFQKK
ncbi:ABC transporter G family member 28 [Solanum dulcamara]|uniref:ABC transporter G family member 28 n=1 Tax=Solanum dulcamara TaxID=45834 RepID=UPI002484FF95|nr:ABC transporter G family member 28 [Solanum dulcamara]